MTANYTQFVSTRGDEDVQVILTATFTGPAATHERVSRLFADALRDQAQTLGAQASAQMIQEHDEADQALRSAMTEALTNVSDPLQRQKLIDRFGLSDDLDPVPQSRSWVSR